MKCCGRLVLHSPGFSGLHFITQNLVCLYLRWLSSRIILQKDSEMLSAESSHMHERDSEQGFGLANETKTREPQEPGCGKFLSQWGRPRFYKRGIDQYPARLSGGFQSPTEIKASGGSQTCAVEGAVAPRTSRQERRGVLESSSRNTRVFRLETRAQNDTCLHREYNLVMKNKSLSCTMLHRSIVTHAQARRIAAAQRGKCFAPCSAR